MFYISDRNLMELASELKAAPQKGIVGWPLVEIEEATRDVEADSDDEDEIERMIPAQME